MNPEILAALGVALGLGRALAFLSERCRMPAVLGEIVAGLILGNLVFFWPGFSLSRVYAESVFLRQLSEFGLLFLLFWVGLESSFQQMKNVGARALGVAIAGVAAPLLLTLVAWRMGLWNGVLAGSERSFMAPLFMGAAMTATSIGIAARILADAKQLNTRTGQMILNAAVMDDVIGLLILGAVSALASRAWPLGWQAGARAIFGSMGGSALKAVLFFLALAAAVFFVFPTLFRRSRHSPRCAALLALIACLGFSWLASALGLAAIVGAFFAGMLWDDPEGKTRDRFRPLVELLSPLFFILIGAMVRLKDFSGFGKEAAVTVLLLVLLGTAGKLFCGAVAGKGVDRVAVGLGMAPRGEVGLIFVSVAKDLGVFNARVFGVMVFAILLSTLIPSALLDRWLRRERGGR